MSEKPKIPASWDKLNLESHLSRLPEGSYVGGRNFILYQGRDNKYGIPRKFKGTKKIPWAAPQGVNKSVGTFWDERTDTMFVFISNSLGNHSIIWHHPSEPSARTLTIGPTLGLSDKPVVGCALVNAEILMFTDGGDYPKMLNINRADNTNKKAVVRLYIPQSDIIVDSRSFSASILLNGNTIVGSIGLPLISSQDVYYFHPMISQIATEWNNQPAFTQYFTAVGCSDYIELTANFTGDYFISAEIQDTIGGFTQPVVRCIAEYVNRYNNPWTFEQVRMSRIDPIQAPAVNLVYDPLHTSNLVVNRVFQFKYGYRLKDKERTLCSPTSDIPVASSGACGITASTPNCIEVNMSSDKWLSDPAMRGEIEFIDIYVRERNDGAWLLVKSLEKYQWVYNRKYRFYNDGAYAAADQSFVEQSFTGVPPRANAMEIFEDSFDNNRSVLGGIVEGDVTPCVQVSAKVKIEPSDSSSETVRVIARILINGIFSPAGNQDYNQNQPIWVDNSTAGPVFGGFGPYTFPLAEYITHNPELWKQNIPLGGFVAYMAGTDLMGISSQANIPANGLSATLWQAPANSNAANRGVFDGTSLGYSVQVSNRTHRSAIRELLEQHHVYSTVEIGGLERGKRYVMRIASNLCDILNDGSLYDLNNPSRDWQRTSTRTSLVGSIPQPGVVEPGNYECIIDVPLVGPPVINIGNVTIMDGTNPNAITGSYVIDGYLFDNLGIDNNSSDDIRLLGVPAERQMVRFFNHDGSGAYSQFPVPGPIINGPIFSPLLWGIYPSLAIQGLYNTLLISLVGGIGGSPVGSNNMYSDHNGYFYFIAENQVGHSPRAQWLTITGNPASPSGSLILGSTAWFDYVEANGLLASKWEGGLDGVLVTNPTAPNLFNGPGSKMYIFANLAQGTNLRTHIKGKVVDVLGNGVPNITALMEGGRFTKTQQDGTFDMVVFGDVESNTNNRGMPTSLHFDQLFFFNTSACQVTFNGGAIRDILIDKFDDIAPYNENQTYDTWLATPVIATVIGGTRRCFSRGGMYPVGYYLKRWDGSRSPVKWIGDMRVPNLGENLCAFNPFDYPPALHPPLGTFYSNGRASIDWSITGNVPIPWTGRWEALQIVVGDDGTRQFQIEWLSSEIVYASDWDGSAPVPTSYSSGNAIQVYISLTDSLDRYKNVNSASMLGYLYEPGDMLRILADRNGNLITPTIEVPIQGQRGKWIIINASAIIPHLYGNERIEIFTPRREATSYTKEVFYDIVQGLVKINDPYSSSPTWATLSGNITEGDTWMLPTMVPSRTADTAPWVNIRYVRESKSISDFYASQDWGKGNPQFVDPDAAVEERGQLMRYSDPYKPGTNINGFNLMNPALSFREAENWLGPIMWMGSVQDVVVCICTNGAFSIYKGIERLEAGPDTLLQSAGKVLASIRPFAHKYGTIHPLSVQRGSTMILWYDQKNAAIVQYGSNALQDVSEMYMTKPFFAKKALEMSPNEKLSGGWDMIHGEYLFSFPPYEYSDGTNVSASSGETMKYFDRANAFTCILDHAPETWGRTRQRLFSFIGEELWEHFVTERWNEVCGQNLPLEIDTPFKAGVNVAWKDTWIRVTGENWDAPRVYNAEGQETSIIGFSPKELYKVANISRDADNHQMRSSEIVIRYRHDKNGYAELIFAYTDQSVSSNVPS